MQGIDAAFVRGEVQARLVEVPHLAFLPCQVHQADFISAHEHPEQRSSPDLHGAVLPRTAAVPAAQPTHCQIVSREQIKGFTSHRDLQRVTITYPRVKITLHKKEAKFHSGTHHGRSLFPFILVLIQHWTRIASLGR